LSNDTSEILQQCISMLDNIINDDSVPRNIRKSAENIKNILLNNKESTSIRVARVVSNLDTMGNDPNIPIHTRTMIWGLSSQLETVLAKNE